MISAGRWVMMILCVIDFIVALLDNEAEIGVIYGPSGILIRHNRGVHNEKWVSFNFI